MDRNHFDKKIDGFLFKAENLIPNEVLPDLPLISQDVMCKNRWRPAMKSQ